MEASGRQLSIGIPPDTGKRSLGPKYKFGSHWPVSDIIYLFVCSFIYLFISSNFSFTFS